MLSNDQNAAGATARLDEAIQLLDSGYVPSWIYRDEQVFELEKQHLFRRNWVFLAHETELEEPGDFVVRAIVDDSILMVRGGDGEVRGFLNQCRHRGSRLCQAEKGKARNFTCIYHAWSYNREGRLVGVPYDKTIYQGLDRDELGLAPVRVEACEGFLFGCMDAAAPSLEEYLGDFRFYLELVTRRSRTGMEVVGVPQRWIVEADWKIAAENLVGDAYHTPFSHKSTFDVGLLPFSSADARPGGSKTGLHIQAGPADVAMIYRSPGTFMGYPPEMVQTLHERIDDRQRALLDDGTGTGDGVFLNRFHVFPNFSCLNVGGILDDALHPYCSVRLWQPRAAGVMEIYSWLLVERDAPAAFKEASRRAYIVSFGPSGMLEQDDMENWRTISRTAEGAESREVAQYARMGAESGVEPIADWRGTGTAYPTQFFDLPTVTFLRRWAEQLRAGVAS
ncbi:aromatic ring-hydroxylating oxygenase subunit alpha [Capillimicrobium parvum]|uniref:Biphenyl 2,3-dioxygenase subunit alpha n=1 Tax=Capillimicrobium parvum TaxID=2884022 RepID=A0A9E6Y180_9ACTN|nr:Rieske 2Fe-2S domain-containing protein [Capillimicrobium parvum]UGS38229.1 Biphenyl 2,3-dioxygenase subunit alpha [Capillimicrobium parvum]